MFNGSVNSGKNGRAEESLDKVINTASNTSDSLLTIDEVQKTLNRSRASVYRYTNTDTRNLNPPFNPRKLNTEFRSDQKDQLLFHPNEVARFAKDILRIKEVTVEILNSPSSETQKILSAILDELIIIRNKLDEQSDKDQSIPNHLKDIDREAA
ncbi:resolvase [Prochlorococcus sp. MIT 1011]|uniref:resolvase n=1 Tax=Prochlorococcus sp. MIT 1011 TaxID=3082520 RepID=UPI0039B3BDE0